MVWCYNFLWQCLGCSQHLELREIYEKSEQKHISLDRFLAKYRLCAIITVFGPTFLTPVCYLILGSPHPSQWQLSIQAK